MQRLQPGKTFPASKGGLKGAAKGAPKGGAKHDALGAGKASGKGGGKGPTPPAGGPPVRPLALQSVAGTARKPTAPATPGVRGLKLKRPDAPGKGAKAVKPKIEPASSTDAASALRVYTKKDEDHIGINTLVGEYREKGTNHQRKCYQKQQKIPGHEEVKVFLYYWDKRDGDDFTGWWFGDQVGGSQVWSRAIDHGQTPPAEGWKIPWDGHVEKDLLLIEPLSSASPRRQPPARGSHSVVKMKSEIVEEAEQEEAAEDQDDQQASHLEDAKDEFAGDDYPIIEPQAEEEEAREEEPVVASAVDLADERVTTVEAEVSQALERVHELVADALVTEDTITEASDILTSHLAAVSGSQKDLNQDIETAKLTKDNKSIVGLARLAPRLRTLRVNINSEAQKLRTQLTHLQKKVAEEKKRNEETKKAAQIELRDSQAFQEALPAAKESVVQAEEAVETVEIMASSVSADLEEELRDDATSAMEDIEQSAKKAQDALALARKVLAEQIQAARRYAQEARKSALKEYSELQDKVTEAHKKLAPFLKFKKDYEEKMKAKKSMDEIATKLGNAELEVEKAHIMSTTGAQEQMSEDELKAAEELLQPAQSGITAAMALMEKKAREPQQGAAPNFKVEIERMQGRAKQSREKLEEVRLILRKQREGWQHQQMLSQVHEKVEKAEDALQKTSEAEMPFFKGIEVLPSAEAVTAIQESEIAASQADMAIGQARSFVKHKLETAKRNPSSDSKVADELNELMGRVEQAAQKLVDFKKDTARRKVQNVLQEAVEKVSEAEAKNQTLAEITKLFTFESLDDVTTDKLRATFDQAAIVEKDAMEALVEARLTLGRKQTEAKASHELVKELSKLQDRLNAVETELRKHKKATSGGERLIKSKQILFEEDEKLKQLESEVVKVEQSAAPLANERLSDEAIKELDESTRDVFKKMHTIEKSLAKHLSDAPAALKAALNKLLARSKKSQEKLDAVKALIREQREWVTAKHFVSEAQAKTKEVENALEKVNDAELPFLKGIEVLPLGEAHATVAQSEEALDILSKAISDARTCFANKKVEIRKFVEKVSQHIEEEFNKCRETIDMAGKKKADFARETDGRRRAAMLQEADALLVSLEEQLHQSIEIASPFAAEDASALSTESATEICQTLQEKDKAAQKKLSEVRQFLVDKQKDVRGHPASEEQMKTLQKRLGALNISFNKAKSSASDNEQRYVARRLLAEATEWVKECEVEVQKAKEAAAPLVQHGGADFLVESHLVTIALAMKDYLKKSSKSRDELFQELSGGAAAISKSAFLKYLEELPAQLERSDLSYTLEQREAMFKHAFGLYRDGEQASSDVQDADIKPEAKTEANKAAQSPGEEVKEAKSEEAKDETKKEETDADEGKTEDAKTEAETEKPKAESAEADEAKVEEGVADEAKEQVKVEGIKEEDVKTEEPKAEEAKPEDIKAEEVKAEEVKAEDLKAEEVKAEEVKIEEAKATDGMQRAAFQAIFGLCERFVCVQAVSVTDSFDISKSKTVTKLELDEVVETIGEPMTNEALGITRVECRLLKREITGWVTMRGNQGTLYLESFSPYDSFVKASERLRQTSVKHAAKVAGHIKAKVADLSDCSLGPLYDVRLDIVGLKPRVASAQKALEILLRQMTQAKKKYSRKEEAEKELQQTVKDKKAADIIMADIKEKADALDATNKHLNEIVKPVLNVKVEDLENLSFEALSTPLTLTESAEQAAAAVIKEYEVVRTCIEAHQAKITMSSKMKGPMLEAKQEIAKLLVKVEATQRKSRAHVEAVRTMVSILGSSCMAKAQVVLRDQVLTRQLTFEALFSELAGGKEHIAEEDFCKYLGTLEGLDLPEEHKRLLARHIDIGGLTARGFRVLLEQYFVCEKRIAVTNDFEISKSKTVRMLDIGETVEVLEGPRGDSKLGVERVRARALSDSVTGWISVKGNQGTPFLKETSRPRYSCTCEVALEKDFRSSPGEGVIRTLESEELLEVIEGPRKDTFDEALRIKGKACSDGAIGWLTLKTKEGVINCEKSGKDQYYVCTAAIAVTDMRDIRSCKVLRKLEVGEVCKVLEGPIDEPEASVTRIHCRSMKDGLQGWMTIKGNAGTVYAEEATKHYTVLLNTPLHRVFSSEGADLVRQLSEGEAFEVLEGPTSEKFDDVNRTKCLAVSDGAIGWVTVKANLRYWNPFHECTASTVMSKILAGKSSEVIRRVEPGELVEILDGPMKDAETEMLRVRARAESDGAVGWVTIKGSQGTLYLAPRTK